MKFQESPVREVDKVESPSSLPSSEYNKMTIFATLLPDEILLRSGTLGKERRRIECVLLMGDVSGFTSLTEKYSSTGRGGTYRMTKTLNAYIGKILEEIMHYGGDILKFSGDAFLCCWHCISDESMANTVNRVVRCALFIQQTIGEYNTDVQISLRVKLAISAGTCTFAVIGTETSRHYIIVGDPIPDIRVTEKICVSGDVVLSPSAWKFCNPEHYIHANKGDQGHIKVISLSKSMVEFNEFTAICEPLNQGDWQATVYNVAKNKNISFLRPFIISPVLKQVDHDQPLKYLTEMRQIVAVFVNILSSPTSVDNYISFIDDAYCMICEVTRESLGCVNEVSLFDKDLMFLILFGLRGFMHDMEIKNALSCAANIQKSVVSLKGVELVSIGITTGVTYSGVVGHDLRREYTVIGSSVNKAARLMVAYPGKITCDRNTFLHSKLPASLFRLQDFKLLKGLSAVEPTYEYLERYKREKETYSGTKYPILGRERAIRIFLSKLAALRGEQWRIANAKKTGTSEPQRIHHSGIAFHGAPRIGKTRLLEELCDQSRGRGLPIQVIPVMFEHNDTPFLSVARLFQQIIGFDEYSAIQVKENTIMSRFGAYLASSELCYLNDIFQVSFGITDAYASESSSKRMAKRQEVISRALMAFCSAAGPIYVIAVDDMHLMDPQSAVIFSSFLDCRGIMLIVTVSEEFTPSESSGKNGVGLDSIDFLGVGAAEAALRYFYQHPRLLHYRISELPLEYMAPLACQILNVRGIPMDLETVLQKESQGNPGWVESYLLSLVQNKALLITNFSGREAVIENLTFPMEKLVTLQEPEDLSYLNINDLEVDDPKQFSDIEVQIAAKEMNSFSYKNQMQWTIDEKDSEKIASYANQRVCIPGPNYKVDDTNIPKTKYGVAMAAFDHLDPFVQLLVKIAAVLGSTCMRVMLVAVMDYPGSKMVAEAVRDVFDAQILCCGNARGRDSSYKLMNNTTDSEMTYNAPECYCDEEYRLNLGIDLPKYAFCSFLKFRTPLHRDTAYGLLTDDQKREFHERAVKYLKGEAHKCNVCGGGPFFEMPSLSAPLSEWLLSYESHNMVPMDEFSSRTERLKSTYVRRIVLKEHGERPAMEFNKFVKLSETKGTSKDIMEEISYKTQAYFDIGDSFIDFCGRGNKTNESVGLRRCDSDVSMGVCLSKVDLRYCECHITLSSIYVQLIFHARAAGLKKILVPLLIEFGAAAVPLGISTQAAKYLSEADQLLQELNEEEGIFDCYWFALGKIRALQSQALCDLGQNQEALKLLLSALKSYGKPLPTPGIKMKFIFMKELFKRCLFHYAPHLFPEISRGSKGLSTALAECLSLIFQISKTQNNWHLAKLAAVKGFNEAVKTKRNFLALGKAYCNCIELSLHYCDLKQCKYIESLALKLCRRISGKVTYDRSHLYVLAQLYCSAFNARLIRGELESAIRIGFRAIRTSNKMHYSASIRLQILPLLVQGLILRCRLTESIDLLHELARTAEEESDSSGMTWYYALCLDLMLSTGCTVERFITCKAYADERIGTMNSAGVRDSDADRYLFISLWLWCVRFERWEEAHSLEDERGYSHGKYSVSAVVTSLGLLEDSICKNIVLSSFSNISIAAKYLEGLQLILVDKLDMRAFSVIPDIHQCIMRVTSILKKVSRNAPVIKPRLTHLIAHFNIIRAKTADALWVLHEAAIQSGKLGNLLEEAWTDHSRNVWLGLISGDAKDLWRDRGYEKPSDLSEDKHTQWSHIMFSLPIPHNFL
ncbi:adenylate cyclase type 10-like [Ischnura elegans]|uniref:adenylate cyclase type 10-like n=1 Tax=Ischnura elegans TaxID=197161 RepID=UPI001ED88F2E|nr:adenylate cyclase type 10-like [Ischnura elegans]